MQTYNNLVWAFHILSQWLHQETHFSLLPPSFTSTSAIIGSLAHWKWSCHPDKYMSSLHGFHLQVLYDGGCCLTHSLPLLVCRPAWPHIFRPWKQASQSLMAPLDTGAIVVAELAKALRAWWGDECYLWQDSRGTFSQVCIQNRGRGDKMQNRVDQQIYTANSSALVFLDIAKEPGLREGEERKLIKTGRLFSCFGHNCPHREIPGCLWEAVRSLWPRIARPTPATSPSLLQTKRPFPSGSCWRTVIHTFLFLFCTQR